MALVLVSDTSVLVDLERGQLLEVALRLPHDFAVPDLLFERELRDWMSLTALARAFTVLSEVCGGRRLPTGWLESAIRGMEPSFVFAVAYDFGTESGWFPCRLGSNDCGSNGPDAEPREDALA